MENNQISFFLSNFTKKSGSFLDKKELRQYFIWNNGSVLCFEAASYSTARFTETASVNKGAGGDG